MVRRPLISSARGTGRTTQSPTVGHPYLRKFRLPHPEEAAGPHTPGLTSLCLLEAGELGRLGSRQALIRLPIHGESGPYLRGGGTVEEGA